MFTNDAHDIMRFLQRNHGKDTRSISHAMSDLTWKLSRLLPRFYSARLWGLQSTSQPHRYDGISVSDESTSPRNNMDLAAFQERKRKILRKRRKLLPTETNVASESDSCGSTTTDTNEDCHESDLEQPTCEDQDDPSQPLAQPTGNPLDDQSKPDTSLITLDDVPVCVLKSGKKSFVQKHNLNPIYDTKTASECDLSGLSEDFHRPQSDVSADDI